jgi:hypothetical protein
MNLTEEKFKEEFREKMLDIIEMFIMYQIPFNIQIINNDNWDKPLPEFILNDPSFKNNLFLSIVNYSLESSFIEEDTGNIVLTVVFGENLIYKKYLLPEEPMFLYDINGNLIIAKPFIEQILPKSKPKLKNEEIEKSMEIFKKNNPGMFK